MRSRFFLAIFRPPPSHISSHFYQTPPCDLTHLTTIEDIFPLRSQLYLIVKFINKFNADAYKQI